MSGTLKLSVLLCNSRSAIRIKISNLKIVYATYKKLTLFFENHVHSWTCIEVLRLGNVNHCVLLYWFYNAPGLYGSSVSLAFNQRKRVGQLNGATILCKKWYQEVSWKSNHNTNLSMIYKYRLKCTTFLQSFIAQSFILHKMPKFTGKTG